MTDWIVYIFSWLIIDDRYSSLFRGFMLSEYLNTLKVSTINRIIQRSFVVGIYLTSIDVVITQELRHDVVMVVVCCNAVR